MTVFIRRSGISRRTPTITNIVRGPGKIVRVLVLLPILERELRPLGAGLTDNETKGQPRGGKGPSSTRDRAGPRALVDVPRVRNLPVERVVIRPRDLDAALEELAGHGLLAQLVPAVRPLRVVVGTDLAVLRRLLGHVELVAVLGAGRVRDTELQAVHVGAGEVEVDTKVVAAVQGARTRGVAVLAAITDVVDEVAQACARGPVLARGDAAEAVADGARGEVVLLRGRRRPLVAVVGLG